MSPHTCVGQLAYHGLYRDTCSENLDNLDHSSITPVRLLTNRTTPVDLAGVRRQRHESHRCDTGLAGMDYIITSLTGVLRCAAGIPLVVSTSSIIATPVTPLKILFFLPSHL